MTKYIKTKLEEITQISSVVPGQYVVHVHQYWLVCFENNLSKLVFDLSGFAARCKPVNNWSC